MTGPYMVVSGRCIVACGLSLKAANFYSTKLNRQARAEGRTSGDITTVQLINK